MAGGMPMPGGWTLSMTWLLMPRQSWLGAGSAFLGMWVVMMIAMMLPSLAVMLLGYRRAAPGLDRSRLGTLTLAAGSGYFFVWAALGAAAYPLGAAAAMGALEWPALARWAPLSGGCLVVAAGLVQLTPWKRRQLERCRRSNECPTPRATGLAGASRHGLTYGVHCSLCCVGYMTLLLVMGMMQPVAIAAVGAAITVERVATRPAPVARATGIAMCAVGMFLVSRAVIATWPVG
jgi:predicted metal-binding membrane protein